MEPEWTDETLLSEAVEGLIYMAVGSTFIDGISFDLNTKIMIVSFYSGDETVYYDKTFEQFKDFVNAPSKGAYYNMHIRGR